MAYISIAEYGLTYDYQGVYKTLRLSPSLLLHFSFLSHGEGVHETFQPNEDSLLAELHLATTGSTATGEQWYIYMSWAKGRKCAIHFTYTMYVQYMVCIRYIHVHVHYILVSLFIAYCSS